MKDRHGWLDIWNFYAPLVFKFVAVLVMLWVILLLLGCSVFQPKKAPAPVAVQDPMQPRNDIHEIVQDLNREFGKGKLWFVHAHRG